MDYLFENIGTNWAVIAHDIFSVYLPLFCLFFIGLCIWSTRNYKRSIDQEKSEELNTAQKQIDHLRLKNINQGIEIERLSDELKTTNGVIKRLNDERQTLKPKRNPDGTFAVTTGKGHQRKRKPERDWTQATEEELLAEAKRIYPVGTKYIGLMYRSLEIADQNPVFIKPSGVEVGIDYVFRDGKWAKIIS